MAIGTEAQTGTKPAAGVIVANPATAPVTKPTVVGLWFLLTIVSSVTQPIIPIAKAIIVFNHDDIACEM